SRGSRSPCAAWECATRPCRHGSPSSDRDSRCAEPGAPGSSRRKPLPPVPRLPAPSAGGRQSRSSREADRRRGSSLQASAGSSCRRSSVVPRIRLCVATRPYRRIIDDHRKAARSLRRHVRARVRAALLYRATPSPGTRPPLSARRQSIGPESIELKLLPQLTGQPAGAPLPRTVKPHLRQTKLNDGGIACHRLASILREQRQCPSTAGVLVEHLDRLAPRRRLRRIDLAEIQHMPLHHSSVIETLVLDHVPVAVRLAVLLSLGAS